jgi:two-component system phosphate regulon sensor histidine kinase PhoR
MAQMARGIEMSETVQPASSAGARFGFRWRQVWVPVRWRVAHWVGLAVVGILAVAAVWLMLQMSAVAETAFHNKLTHQARAAAGSPRLVESWVAGTEALTVEVNELSRIVDAPLVAISAQGEFLVDSRPGAQGGATRWAVLPEVRTALNGEIGQTTRLNPEVGSREFFVAVPVRERGVLLGVLHFAFMRQELTDQIRRQQAVIVAIFATVALVVGLLTVALAEYLAFGVRRLTQVVERITAGDLDARILSLRHAELGNLAQAFNRMADKLQSQMKKRAREKDRLNTVMHVMTDGVVILNRSGDVKLINPAGARLLNTTAEKSMHRSFVQTVRDHRIAEIWKRCQESGQEEVAAIELGSTQFVRVIVTPFLKRIGRGYLVIIQDLTQVRRLQTVRQDFISNVSHELRTPLASLRALVETLRDGALDDPPAAGRFLDRMEIEVDALTQMVEELLELSRIESGQVPLRLNPVLPNAVIVPAVERLRPQAERSRLEMTVDVPRDLPLVLVDSGKIHQVVSNLVHNAIKFTPPGGTIAVHASANAALVTVVVADSGLGIATNDLPRIFERFYKTDRSRAVGGTGLGLAIAKHIVQAHGGAIWAESQEGRGSTFYFTLPRAESEGDANALLSQTQPHLPDSHLPDPHVPPSMSAHVVSHPTRSGERRRSGPSGSHRVTG